LETPVARSPTRRVIKDEDEERSDTGGGEVEGVRT
jgi:hypothetical protein